ncbi:hypothetical protein VPHK406_0178 [Vibrio phage K406]
MNYETKQYIKSLFEKHCDGVPESEEDMLNKDLYSEQAFDILCELCEAVNVFQE